MNTPSKNRKILVTSALLYANGPIHLGHLVEWIQTDIWVRFQRMQGQDCLYICGEDAHGTPIMISAQKANLPPEELINCIGKQHAADAHDFLISFDNYYTTHSEENRQLSSYVYKQLVARKDIDQKIIQQAFDPIKEMFLPDRYIKGNCPSCDAADQYGDNCEACGATYTPNELKNPVSVLSGVQPIQKESLHYFFRLDHYAEMLKQWLASEQFQPQIVNKLNEWFKAGLEPWDISRDAPYFGFEIPDAPGKYFYVWLDAPIGYMASLKNLCERNKALKLEDYFGSDSQAELYHFIGKDIVYFHAFFWPAMLQGAGFRKPTAVFAHGFLTIDGQKMSKSRGTFIKARTYLNHLDPEYLRYYFATKLTASIEDIDLSMDDFMQRVNADLIGKIINIASRSAVFIQKYFSNMLAPKLSNPALYEDLVKAGDTITNKFEAREFSSAIRDIMELADRVNQYIDAEKPWVLIKEPDSLNRAHDVCTMALNLFRILIAYLKPVLPKLAEKVEAFLNISPLSADNYQIPLLNHTIQVFTPLMQRITPEHIAALRSAIAKEQAEFQHAQTTVV